MSKSGPYFEMGVNRDDFEALGVIFETFGYLPQFINEANYTIDNEASS